MSESEKPATPCCSTESGKTGGGRKRKDWMLILSSVGVFIFYILGWQGGPYIEGEGVVWLKTISETVFFLMNEMWVGLLISFIMVGILSRIPREFVMSILGPGGRLSGILRATLGGILLDLCNHGILMVSTKLYERGASIGQMMAFLIASPWNSFTLTVILISFIGWSWTLLFIALSMIIAVVAGLIFELLVNRGILPANPNTVEIPQNFRFWKSAAKGLRNTRYDGKFFADILLSGCRESLMVLRWLLFGVLLAGLLRIIFSPEMFSRFFGPSLIGLGATIVFATIVEVCSEGSVPIAVDIMNRAGAPGNSFAFLMTGVSTDYTEIMIVKGSTKSWKTAIFIPIITLPQVILVSWIINHYSL